MCVIIHCPTNKRPSVSDLKKCNEANPHGIGIVTEGDKMFAINKGISFEALLKIVKEATGELAIHFRYATAGGKGEELCHPFPCTHKAETWLDYQATDVLMTNGTWINWEQAYATMRYTHGIKKLSGKMSDTRALAHMIAETEKHGWLKYISDRHHAHKRVRALYCTKRYEKSFKRYGEWSKHTDGCYYSNLRWRTPAQPKRSYSQKLFGGYKPLAKASDIIGQQDFSEWIGRHYN